MNDPDTACKLMGLNSNSLNYIEAHKIACKLIELHEELWETLGTFGQPLVTMGNLEKFGMKYNFKLITDRHRDTLGLVELHFAAKNLNSRHALIY